MREELRSRTTCGWRPVARGSVHVHGKSCRFRSSGCAVARGRSPRRCRRLDRRPRSGTPTRWWSTDRRTDRDGFRCDLLRGTTGHSRDRSCPGGGHCKSRRRGTGWSNRSDAFDRDRDAEGSDDRPRSHQSRPSPRTDSTFRGNHDTVLESRLRSSTMFPATTREARVIARRQSRASSRRLRTSMASK